MRFSSLATLHEGPKSIDSIVPRPPQKVEYSINFECFGRFLSGYWPEGMPVMSELLCKKPIDRDGGA